MPSNTKHAFTSAKADDADATLIRPSNWNAAHVGAVEILDRDLGQVEVVNDGSETTIYSHSIPANQLGATGGIRLTISGDYLNNSGASRRIRFRAKLGATTALDTGDSSVITVSADRRSWTYEVWFFNSAADAQKWGGRCGFSIPSSVSMALSDSATARADGDGSSSEDTTGALTLLVSVDHDAAHASLSIRKETAFLEEFPAA